MQDLTERQQRELAYHREHRQSAADLGIVSLDIVANPRRRWWNAYWHTYSHVRGSPLRGQRVLVAGCGFGEDALRMAATGAEVYAFDLSPESIAVARQRPGAGMVRFAVMPAERLEYPDNFFDAVLFIDILHHVDIPATVAEIRRVLKPGALVIGDELYTHSLIERIRQSRMVARGLYPRMQRFIYGCDQPYITLDEHKIDEHELAVLLEVLAPRPRLQYFNLFVGRLVPARWDCLAKVDRLLLMMFGPLGRWLAGRIVFLGRVRKECAGPA